MQNRRHRVLLVLSALSLALVAACEPAPGEDGAKPAPSASAESPPPSEEPGPEPQDPEESEAPDPGTSPSPSPSPSPSLEPEPEPEPEAPEPSPTSSPSPSPTPSPSASPRPTPTPTPEPPATNQGFTPVRPSADSRLVYVSSSTGDDANPCTEAKPCRSLEKGTSLMRAGYPDHLYLKAGDVWKNESLGFARSGRSASEPAVVTSYGKGARPRLESRGGTRVLSFNTGRQGLLDSVWFIGLHVANVRLDPAHPEFTGVKEDKQTAMFLGGHKNILLEDNVFDHMEVVFQEWEGRNPESITIRRNIFTGAYTSTSSYSQSSRPSNMYLDGLKGMLLEENVFDHGGWNPVAQGAGANMYNHNVYVQYSPFGATHEVRGNFFTNASSHGIQMRSGGVAEDNFFGRNAIALLLGYGEDKPLGADAPVRAVDNVVTEGHSMMKGHDFCEGPNLCTLALWGIELKPPRTHPIVGERNVIHSRSRLQDEGFKKLWPQRNDLSVAGLQVYNQRLDPKNPPAGVRENLEWHWLTPTQDTGSGDYPDPGRTLGDYFQHLRAQGVLDELVRSGLVDRVRQGEDDFDSFVQLQLHRAPGTWDERITAGAVNDWIRAGFGL